MQENITNVRFKIIVCFNVQIRKTLPGLLKASVSKDKRAAI
ncbi:MAG TPA: hypothetical protein VFZ33_08725 [Chitinophagaceae bacterium]